MTTKKTKKKSKNTKTKSRKKVSITTTTEMSNAEKFHFLVIGPAGGGYGNCGSSEEYVVNPNIVIGGPGHAAGAGGTGGGGGGDVRIISNQYTVIPRKDPEPVKLKPWWKFW